MKTLKTIVLRSDGAAFPGVDFPFDPGMLATTRWSAPSRKLAAEAIKTEVVEATAADRADMARNPKVLGTVLAMPIMPVRALNTKAVATASGSSWGIDAVGAAKLKDGGKGATVAVLDTGIDRSHAAFKRLEFHDLDNDGGAPGKQKSIIKNFTGEASADEQGHGTHCAGTILGSDVDGYRIGVATGVDRVLIGKVLGSQGGSSEAIYQAVLWALENGAHVISMSLGMDFPGFQKYLVERGYPPEQATSMALLGYRQNLQLFDRLADLTSGPGGAVAGTVIVSAAGNESDRPRYSITVAPPAAGERIVAVGALQPSQADKDRYEVAQFSNDGVDIVAPGVDIVSARLGGGLVSSSGTSMATPHVAGIAAVAAAQLIEKKCFSAARLIDHLNRSARPLAYLNASDVGAGLACIGPV